MHTQAYTYHLRQQITRKGKTVVIHSCFPSDVFKCLKFSSYGL